MADLNGLTAIGIEITHGIRSVTEEDRDRAKLAAAAVLNRHGVTAAAAEAEYQDQWDEFDDEAKMTGLAHLWIMARQAADIALTEGWADPNGAFCSITA